MKILIDVWLDGYDNVEKMYEAVPEFVYESLNITASSVKVLWVEDLDDVKRNH